MITSLTQTVYAAATGQFLGVDWGNFVVVFIVALLATFVTVLFYALGLRLLSHGELEPSTDGANGTDSAAAPRPAIITTAAFACFAVSAAAVLYGLYLAIPQFH